MPIPRKSSDDFFIPESSFLEDIMIQNHSYELINDDDEDNLFSHAIMSIFTRFMDLIDDVQDSSFFVWDDDENIIEENVEMESTHYISIDFDSEIIYNETNIKNYHTKISIKSYLDICQKHKIYKKFLLYNEKQSKIGSKELPKVKFRANKKLKLYLKQSKCRKGKHNYFKNTEDINIIHFN